MKIFLSYTRDDQDKVKPFYEDLKNRKFTPWMDFFDLLPGMSWNDEIKSHMSDTDVCILFISSKSLDRIGYVRRELNYFIDKLDEFPKNYIFCIPILLDDCLPPSDLTSKVQYIKVPSVEDESWNKVLSSLSLAASQRNIVIKSEQNGVFEIEMKYDYEIENGNPGYQFSYSYPYFDSKKVSIVARELNQLLTAQRMSDKLSCRILPNKSHEKESFYLESFLESEKEILGVKNVDYGVANQLRVNNDYSSTVCDVCYLSENFVSLRFDINYYSNGAAHDNYYTKNMNLRIKDNKLYVLSFCDFFYEDYETEKEILEFFQNVIVREVQKQKFLRHKKEYDENEDDWLIDGINGLRDESFNDRFSIDSKGWVFHFDPYVIDCFAAGKYEVSVPHESLYEWYRQEYKDFFFNETDNNF